MHALKKEQPALLVTDCKNLYDATHKEGAAPSSTDKRLAIELAIVKSRAAEDEADLRMASSAVPDCRLSHQARMEKV